jgi:nucleotide-binding universal stress UspA family protein
MFDHILAPLDGSPLAEIVLPHLVLLARLDSARITIMRVVTAESGLNSGSTVDPFEWQLRKAEVEAYLQGVAGRLSEVGLEVETILREGSAAEVILDYAAEQGVDLILVSSHGESGLTGWNVSSVVQKIILRARTSVMIVRAYRENPAGLNGVQYDKIMLPLDESARAEAAIPAAAAIARETGAALLVVHVVQKPVLPRRTPLDAEDIELSNRLIEKNRLEALRYLDELPVRIGQPVETRLLIDETPVAALHRLAEQDGIQLVVLSAHGYSGDTRWPFGSMVVSFLAYGSTPLLVIQDMPAERIEPTMAEVVSRERGGR